VRRRLIALVAVALACQAAPARAAGLDDPAAQWLPRADGAGWIYQWGNSAYSPARLEHYALSARSGTGFRISWEEFGLRPDESPAAGFADFRHTDAGLVNVNFQSTPVPPQFPVLCATALRCGNSLAGTYFLTMWGTRSPVLAEPLVKGTRWNSIGGTSNDVTAANRYMGREKVIVPAFPQGVTAAKVQSVIAQAGALGDPFGSGLRTIWWVYGVGPVKVVFQHASGDSSVATLQQTNLAPLALPDDRNLMPLSVGQTAKFRWRNSKHMKRWSQQTSRIAALANNTARIDVRDTHGPIDVNASYVFSSRLGGLTNVTTKVSHAHISGRWPKLGPAKGPQGRARFATPYDLMAYGFGPVLPAYPVDGQTWRSARDSRDFALYGVSGVSEVLGTKKIRTPAGRFRALAVRSRLSQAHHAFGSGSRTMYFAPDIGLVKLIFRHDDGSVSTVERVK
jgi:hypothetical protein